MTNSSRDLIEKTILTLILVAIMLLIVVPTAIRLFQCTSPIIRDTTASNLKLIRDIVLFRLH